MAAILVLTVTAGWTEWVVLVVGWASVLSIADYTLALAWALERAE